MEISVYLHPSPNCPKSKGYLFNIPGRLRAVAAIGNRADCRAGFQTYLSVLRQQFPL